jgi:hypothetical protein
MRIRRVIEFILVLGILSSVAAVAQGVDTPESQEGAIGHTPPRLSLTTGEVSFWRPGAQDWSEAQVNTPLAPGDLLYTGPQANLEIQIGARAFVRGGPDTQLGLENHEPDFLQFKVTAGDASFDLRTVEPGLTVELDTPHAVFTIEQGGYYRVAVNGDRTSFITRRGGQATIAYPGGESVSIGPSEEVTIEGIERTQIASYAAPQLDEWDKWNYARTDHLLDAVSARYVSPGVYGVDDLDRHGTWRTVPTYGSVWIPRGVPSGWAPYSTGAWVLDPYYGWTWVDTAPWGWAPYHYGRWLFVSGFWAWTPGPVVVRPAYAPALVAFLGGPSAGVSISVGAGPVVGWVSLGWGEPCVPWWGPSRFRHRPWWGGWGGPRVVNNVIINRTTVVNVQEINVYRNVGTRNAVVVVKENHFGRGSVTSARIRQVDAKDFKPIHTEPRVTATPASFTPREKRGISPPKKVLDRSVVATRQPQSRAESRFGKERKEEPARVPTPEPRIVSAPRQRETAPALQRPPYGQSKVERGTTDRARPPAPPKAESPQVRKQVSEGAPAATPQAQQQRESQVVRPSSPEKPQPSSPQAEAGQTQQPAPRKTEGPQIRERESERAPSVTPQAQQQERGSKVAPPSSTKPQAPARQTEAKAPPAQVLPGEPANRLSPNRGDRREQKRMEERREPERMPEQGAPRNGPRRGRSE